MSRAVAPKRAGGADRANGAVLCAGRVYCDLVFSGLDALPRLGRETYAEALSLHAGGGAWVTAGWLACLGRAVELCATLPAAPFDAIVTDAARAAGVRPGISTAATDGDPQVTCAMALGGDRAFLTRRPGSALPVDRADAIRRPGLAHLHVGELATLLECPDLVPAARAAGLTVSLDCGWDDAVFERHDLVERLTEVDVFLPNEDESAALVARGLPERPAPLTVIKRGARGATAIGEAGRRDVAGRAVEPVDATGAGDAFDAGFVHAWLEGRSVERCLALGNECGARAVVRHGGASGLPAWR